MNTTEQVHEYILFCSAPGRGFHPGPSRRRWRDWLRLHRSDSQPTTHHNLAFPIHPKQQSSSYYFLSTSHGSIITDGVFSGLLCFLYDAQKSDIMRSPDVTQRTLFLLDEVSRKRGLFEKEKQEVAPSSPGISRQVHSLLTIHF